MYKMQAQVLQINLHKNVEIIKGKKSVTGAVWCIGILK